MTLMGKYMQCRPVAVLRRERVGSQCLNVCSAIDKCLDKSFSIPSYRLQNKRSLGTTDRFVDRIAKPIALKHVVDNLVMSARYGGVQQAPLQLALEVDKPGLLPQNVKRGMEPIQVIGSAADNH